MKGFKSIIICLAALLCCQTLVLRGNPASFAPSLPRRLETFVEKVEDNCRDWTKEDWQRVKSEYQGLMTECREAYDSMSESEQKRVNAAIGKYRGILVKMGMEDVEEVLKDYGKRIPEQIKGFISAFE